MERVNQILNMVAAIFGIVAAVATVLSIVPGWSSNLVPWAVTFGPTALIVFAMIASLLSRYLISAVINVCALVAYAVRFEFDGSPLTRDSVMWFVTGCTTIAMVILVTLGAYFIVRILKVMEKQLALVDLVSGRTK